MKVRIIAISLAALAGFAPSAFATDPPHNAVYSIKCTSCHQNHTAPGGTITRVKGNANLCMSCHTVGGTAAAHPFTSLDQAMPSPGLPTGVSASGTSHRWDSGASGRVAAVATNTSTGQVESAGAYTGVYAKAYTITITTAGAVGTARFGWTATSPPGGSGVNLATAASVALDQGITVAFTNGAGTSFVLNDKWYVYVRPDINQPTSGPMSARVSNGKIMCSTCHDVHSQAREPFDTAAPPYAGAGSGASRHFQRIANDTNLMCTNCHAARNVTASSAGSHPVGVVIPAGAYRNPTLVPLDKTTSNVRCSSCHTVHYAPVADGKLLRVGNVNSICTDCHTLADTVSPASHLLATNVRALWPGGQYGTTFPAITGASNQGSCGNCHQPHGWPDTANTAVDYPRLTVDREEKLCNTCHDGAPVTKNVMAEITKTYRHPTGDFSLRHNPGESAATAFANGTARHAECEDCHNPHQARADAVAPVPPAASNRIRKVSGIQVTNGASGLVPTYTFTADATREYELCFKCHSSWTTLPATARNKAVEFNPSNESFHPIEAAGKNKSTQMTQNLLAGTGLPHLTTTSVIACADCHSSNSIPTTVSTLAAYSGTIPKGPHGSTVPQILRANYLRTLPAAGNYNAANFTLCYICHSPAPAVDSSGNSRSDTNFRFHGYHLSSISGKGGAGSIDTIGPGTAGPGQAICKECHYQQHSNKLTTHTTNRSYQRMVNFSPSISGSGGAGAPSWDQANKRCSLRCHNKDHTNWMSY